MPGSRELADLTREDFLAMLRSPDSPETLEWKIGPTGIVDDDDDGLITAIVAVTGIVDEVNDVILPGAFTDTLKRRVPKGVWSHDVHTWVSRTEGIGELMPGDPRLPAQWKGQPWPADAGALVARTRFNLGTRDGRDAYSNVKFFDSGPLGPQVEWSIGYNSLPGYTRRNKAGQRELAAIDLYEYGPVLFGAMPLAGTVGTKARIEALEHKGGPFMGGTILGDLELKVAGKEASPKDVKNTQRLKEYWERGEGAAKIRWGEPGDFDRCVTELSKYMPPTQVKGYCANRHKGATGGWPGHAPGVEQAEATAKKAEHKASDLLALLEGKGVEVEDRPAAEAALRELGLTDAEVEAAFADPEWTSLPADLTTGPADEPEGGGDEDDPDLGDPTGGVEYKATRAVDDLEVGDVVLELKSNGNLTLSGRVKAITTRAGLTGIALDTKSGVVETVWVPSGDVCSVRDDPYSEIKSGMRLVLERKDYPYLPGSVEARQQDLRAAVNDLLMPEPDDKGNRTGYVSLDATFADYVVATLNDYSIGVGSDGEQSFAVPYTITGDGEVDLGQPIPVERQVMLVPADADDTPPPPASVSGGMNPAMTLARKIATQAKALVDDLEAKSAAGESLSGTHVRRIRATAEALDGALAGLGQTTGPAESKADSSLLGEAAQLLARSALL